VTNAQLVGIALKVLRQYVALLATTALKELVLIGSHVERAPTVMKKGCLHQATVNSVMVAATVLT
jgi:hypothetical protein